eukprot:TRINITY_DN4791_c8_g1_i1.p1 TRINITY_DN4791_c8_g1~~TRINITY_DN4791_c8_g1_i1.p1  ORF type:complete len:246 (+),score=37.07 TRINITY_DN4791_c8_g1_i1:44-739(+)
MIPTLNLKNIGGKDSARLSERKSDRPGVSARSASTSLNSSYRERDWKDRTNVFSDLSADDYIVSPVHEAHLVRIEKECREFYISELTRKSSMIEERLEEVVKDMERLDGENQSKSARISDLESENQTLSQRIAELEEELREKDAQVKKLQAGPPPTSPAHRRIQTTAAPTPKPATPQPKTGKSRSPRKKASKSPTVRSGSKGNRTPTPPPRRGSLTGLSGYGSPIKQKIFR